MKLQEYLQIWTLIACKGNGKKNYAKSHFIIPAIICKDGFIISVQVNSSSRCTSENGNCTYGETWLIAEWGFPNRPIDGMKYNCVLRDCEDFKNEDTTESMGSASVKDLQELLDEHGGIDVIQTFSSGWDAIEQ